MKKITLLLCAWLSIAYAPAYSLEAHQSGDVAISFFGGSSFTKLSYWDGKVELDKPSIFNDKSYNFGLQIAIFPISFLSVYAGAAYQNWGISWENTTILPIDLGEGHEPFHLNKRFVNGFAGVKLYLLDFLYIGGSIFMGYEIGQEGLELVNDFKNKKYVLGSFETIGLEFIINPHVAVFLGAEAQTPWMAILKAEETDNSGFWDIGLWSFPIGIQAGFSFIF